MITFYVQGSSLERSNLSYYDSAKNWISQTVDHLPELTLDEFLKWTKDHSAKTWDQFVQSFKYLSGTPTAKAPSIPDPSISTESKAPESNTQKWTGIFSSLRKTRSEPVETRSESPSTFYTDGEAHAEFIRNDDGYFVCRYILVDIPNSRSRNPIRVFVERTAGVREDVMVLRYS